MEHYGVQVYRHGIIYHRDGRWRREDSLGRYLVPNSYRRSIRRANLLKHGFIAREGQRSNAFRGAISGLSRLSARRLEFVAANAAVRFRGHLTLTYRAAVEGEESKPERNRRVAERSKRDLKRFLNCLRGELGAYLWVQEFQDRGVVHYHVIAERSVDEDRVRTVWLRAINALDDPDAIKHGVNVEPVGEDDDLRRYLSRYMGKIRQKTLPEGVERAGRWWGRPRALALDQRCEIVGCRGESADTRVPEMRAIRSWRRWVSGRLGWKFRGGMLLDWGGELSAASVRVLDQLRAFNGETPEPQSDEEMMALLERHGWEQVQGGGNGRTGMDVEAGTAERDELVGRAREGGRRTAA